MKVIEMYYTVHTLVKHGWSISGIAIEFGIDKKTDRKIREKVKNGHIPAPRIKRKSKLDKYREVIREYLDKGFSDVLIHRKFTGVFKPTIKQLLQEGLIGYTIPKKPRSRLQKFMLTAKGEKDSRWQEAIDKFSILP